MGTEVDRVYTKIIIDHLQNWEQMVFIEGARQAGKTTIAKQVIDEFDLSLYLNWDNIRDRELMLKGQDFVLDTKLFTEASLDKPIIVFDEIHKMPNWKNYLKGFYDTYKGKLKIIATGSSKLGVYKKGQDSLMGRYFNYTVFPLSVGELSHPNTYENTIYKGQEPDESSFEALYEFGGFPDPLSKKDTVFSNRWNKLRMQQLFREDINIVEDIKNIQLLETLAFILEKEATSQVNYARLARQVHASDQSIRKWIAMLETFYFGFALRPWQKNVKRSVLKEPKFYLTDWSKIKDPGKRSENFIACHLHKAVSFWNETGKGDFGLHYLRDKEKREVDFLLVKDGEPWVAIEVKHSNSAQLSSNLKYFQREINIPHAFQVVLDMPAKGINFFEFTEAVKVPARDFLVQLP